jgi:hypothetical protein
MNRERTLKLRVVRIGQRCHALPKIPSQQLLQLQAGLRARAMANQDDRIVRRPVLNERISRKVAACAPLICAKSSHALSWKELMGPHLAQYVLKSPSNCAKASPQ